MEKDILAPANTQKIYSTGTFAIATLLGGPLAAAYMASWNFKRLGEAWKAPYAWLTAFVLLCLAAATSFVAAFDAVPPYVFTLLFLLIVQVLVHRFQAKQIRQHIEEGGAVYPVWRAVVIGLIGLVILLAFLFGLFYLLDSFVPRTY
jgi:hypothetical protein